jgi:acetyltransferase-like isoleucine patch superfamily enzyme
MTRDKLATRTPYNLVRMSGGLRTPRNGVDLYRAAVRVRNAAATMLMRRSFAQCGEGSRLSLPIELTGPGSPEGISIGKHTFIGPSCRLWLDAGATVRIGDHCYLNGMTTFFAADQIEIGNAVLMAWNVNILDFHHRTTDRTRPIKEQGIDRVAPVKINDGAWLGTNVVVMPGVTIGRNAVVGANAVVNSDVPDFATAVGVPARIL